VNRPLDDPWDPGSLTNTSRSTAESHLTVSISAWLGDPWRVNIAAREIVAPGRQRLQIRLEEAAGAWMLHVTGMLHPGGDTFELFQTAVAAVLPPSQIAAAIGLHLLPEYELAIARAFEGRSSVEAAEHRLIAAQTERLALVLGPAWRFDEPEHGTARVARGSAGEADTVPRVEGKFVCRLDECELSLRVDWGLAHQIAKTVADYTAARGVHSDHQRQSTPAPTQDPSTVFPDGDDDHER